MKEHGDSHGTNTAGDGCDVRGNLGGGLEFDIANKTLTRLLGSVGNVVGANVDDNGALLELLALDETSLANSNNHDVGILEVLVKILGPGVANSDGGICVLQEVADRTANNVASANNYGVLSLEVDTGFLEKDHDTLGCAGDEIGVTTTLGQLTDVVSAEAVDILLAQDGGCDSVLRNMAW